MRIAICAFSVISVIVTGFALTASPSRNILVEVKRKPSDAEWMKRETRLLQHVAGFTPRQVELSKYGGLKSAKVEATGFFHAKKIDGQWWLVDPEGYLFLSVGVTSIRTNQTPRGEAAFVQKFGSRAVWAQTTNALLCELGFNTLGCWCWWEDFRNVTPRLSYTTQSNFMSSYGKIRGGTFQQPGHTGYPNDCLFVFDPEFAKFCEKHAMENLSATKDDPYLLGHFSDNELPFRQDALDRYLSLKETDPGYQAAKKWAEERNVKKGASGYSDADREAFLEFLSATYFRIVSQAIKKADPHHLYLGSRFHGSALRFQPVFKGCGPFVDVVSVNYYGAWTPVASRMSDWATWSGKPFLITEFYAKGMDSGLPNVSGAGWVVKTQADRGRFYQNFALGLLEHPACVGWHWFKYIDNDPTDTKADPSNNNSNKGIVSNVYEAWQPLCDAMKKINRQVYPLREFLLKRWG
jgi:hypothetical protein